MSAGVGLVLVAHAGELARGAATVARQMAPEVEIAAVGGFLVDQVETLGTDVGGVLAAVESQLDAGRDVVVLGDLGSALLTAGLVLELLEPERAARVRVAEGPFVEGAVAAAVKAAGGASLEEVTATVTGAASQWSLPAGAGVEPSEPPEQDGAARVVLGNTTGLHARPAALLARLVARFDAKVTVNDAPAESVFELMKLGALGGAELLVSAVGPQAEEAREAVVEAISSGLGEH